MTAIRRKKKIGNTTARKEHRLVSQYSQLHHMLPKLIQLGQKYGTQKQGTDMSLQDIGKHIV